jgi:HAD-hyrolase-like
VLRHVALRLACARAGLEPSDVIFIGDRVDKDIAMVRAAGAQAVLLDRSGGVHAPAESIGSLTEILTWEFETLGRQPDGPRAATATTRRPPRRATSTAARVGPGTSAALYQRFGSRGAAHYADQLLSAMRQQFGGHLELTKAER